MPDEIGPVAVRVVEGAIPQDLRNGALLRNGPNARRWGMSGGWLDGVLLAASTCEAMVDLSRLWALQGSLADAHAHARAACGLARRSGQSQPA